MKKVSLSKLTGIATMIVMATFLLSCGNQEQKPSVRGIDKVMCDESFKNILDDEIDVFEYRYKDASIVPIYTSETAAFDSLMNKKCELIITYRELTANQKAILKSQKRAYRCRQIAVDGLAIIVNRQNDIEELSMEDLEEIFSGKVKTWGEVFPTKLKGDSIQVVFDGNGSGAIHYIRDKFLGGGQLPIKFYAQKSTEEVFEAVEKHRAAIGIVGVSWLSPSLRQSQPSIEERIRALEENNEPSRVSFTDKIKVMPIRSKDRLSGVKPYQAYLYDGSYPLFRPIYAIDASLGGVAHNFFTFITGTDGQKIILQTGIVPAAEPIRLVEVK